MELLVSGYFRNKLFFLFTLIFFLSGILAEPPTMIVVGKKNFEINIQSDCEQYEIMTNYKEIFINISNMHNLESVLITDKPLTNCGDKDCQSNANICQIRSTNDNSEINFNTKMCIASVYINARKSKTSDENAKHSFQISTDYVAGGSCSYIHENAYAYCGESSLEDCRACNRPGCTVIQCGNEINEGTTANPELTKFHKLYELCVPYTISGEEKNRKCLSFQDVTTYRPTHECEFDDLNGYSSLTVFLLGVLVIVVLVFSLAVIYYNVYLIKYQSAPFDVPAFLPEFLFPRTTNQRTRTTIDNRLDDVFSSDNRQNF